MKAVVLLSGGLDSSVNLYETLQRYEVACVLTINYGQKALEQEVKSAKILCQKLKLKHQILDLSWLKDVSPSSLNQSHQDIPDSSMVDINSVAQSQESAKSVWVPNRNGLFLNVAAAVAEGLGAKLVVPGFNLEEAQTFPDNSEAFLQTLNQSFEYSTQNHVKVFCFTTDLNKTQIIQRAIDLGLDLSDLWPCYRGQKEWCLDCESCLRFVRACKAIDIDVQELRAKRGSKNAI